MTADILVIGLGPDHPAIAKAGVSAEFIAKRASSSLLSTNILRMIIAED